MLLGLVKLVGEEQFLVKVVYDIQIWTMNILETQSGKLVPSQQAKSIEDF